MARETPFTYSFSILNGTTKTMTFSLGVCSGFISLTINVVDDGLGPILINAKITSGSLVHQLGQPTAINDGDGINAVRFAWDKKLIPLSRSEKNLLIIQASNYCGDDIETVKFTGVKRK